MKSGMAYRPEYPGIEVLNLYQNPRNHRLYKAPRKKRSKARLPSTPPASKLPVELLHEILLELDLSSLGMLRRVNTTTRALVESLPAYSLLMTHASDTLNIMYLTQCDSYFPIRWLYEELCHPRCRACNDFGPFLYLPSITRLCFMCTLYHPKYQVAPAPDIMFNFGLSQYKIKFFPIIYSLPEYKRRPKRFIDVSEARELGIRLHGSIKNMKQDRDARWKEREERAQQKFLMWHEDTNNGDDRRRPRSQRSFHADLIYPRGVNYWSLNATTSFPYWDRQKHTLELGVYCQACTYHWEEIEDSDSDLDYWSDPEESEEWKEGEDENNFIHTPKALARQPQGQRAYHRAFLEVDFPKHLLHCPAVKKHNNFRIKRRTGSNFIKDVKRFLAVSRSA